MYRPYLLLLFLTTALLPSVVAAAANIPDPLICEDTLDGSPPFSMNAIPCLIECNGPVNVPTGSLLPGSINVTNIPYCQLACVRPGTATPAQSAAAPDCYGRCQARRQGTPENVGWCMYWCVDGYGDLVESTTCVPSLRSGDETMVTTEGGRTYTYIPPTQPAEWQSWYRTQTVIPYTGNDGHDIGATPSPTPTPSSTITVLPSIQTVRTSSSEESRFSQETQTSGASTGVESVQNVVTMDPAAASPSPTSAASRFSKGGVLEVLGTFGVSIMVALM